MTRQVNVATKAAAQVLGHLTKVIYFAVLIDDPAGRDLEQWLVMAYAAAFAVLGTTLVAQLPRPYVGQAVLSLDAPRDPGAGRGLYRRRASG